MKCTVCDVNLFIASNKTYSPISETKIYSEQTLVCTNPKCELYAGKDLNNPLHIAKTITNTVSEG